MPSLMASKGRWNGTCHISCLNFFQFSFGGSLSDRRMEMLDTFYIAFKWHHRGFKGKVDLNKKLAQKYTFEFQLYIFLYEL